MDSEKDRDAPDKPNNPGRRRVIGGAAAGLAVGAVAGMAGGAALAASSAPPAIPSFDGRRRFAGKVVLITGATSGIGRAAALAFAREGGKVAFCGRRENLGREIEREIRAGGGEAIYIKADVRAEDQVRRFVARAVQTFGGLNVAFNNAGITLEKPLHEYSAAEWDDVVNTNLRGVFLAMKYEIPQMLERGGGTILATASNSVRAGAYAATKHGLAGLIKAAALNYAKQGIRVNAIVPGTTNTALVRGAAGMENMPDAAWRIGAAQWGKSNVPVGRMATPEEIASFALAVASDEFPYVTGASLVIDGGGPTGG